MKIPVNKESVRSAVRSASRELFTVMNDRWQISEDAEGLFELSTRDGQTKLGPLSGEDLASALAVISELERHLRS